MDDTIFFQKAKEVAKRNLQEDLETLEKIDSIDALIVFLFGESYSALTGFHVCKKYAIDKTSVSKGCRSIQDDYLKRFKSSD